SLAALAAGGARCVAAVFGTPGGKWVGAPRAAVAGAKRRGQREEQRPTQSTHYGQRAKFRPRTRRPRNATAKPCGRRRRSSSTSRSCASECAARQASYIA